MSPIDVVILVLGLVLAVMGIGQLATGKNIIGGFARRQVGTPTFFRAFGAMYAFLGLLIALNAFQGPFGKTGHLVLTIVAGMGILVSGTWALVHFARSRPAGGNRP